MRYLVLAAAAVLSLSNVAQAASRNDSKLGATSILTDSSVTVPFPEGILVRGREVYVAGPATFGTAGTGPSEIRVHDVNTGALKRILTIQGQDLSQEHALTCLTMDGRGRLYVIETQQGVLRLDPDTGAQEHYAPAPTVLEGGPFPLPNDLTFDHDGWLYITDSFQGALWRVPPGGGTIELWFRSPELASGMFQFGPNGIRMHPRGKELWFTHTAGDALYALPLVDAPQPSDLRLVHRFTPGSGPDGLAFGASGRVYVALAYSNQLSVLERSNGLLLEGRVGGTAPWDSPANVAFTSNGSVLLTNHAITSGRPESFMVLDVFVDDRAARSARPRVP
jgi:sugar lactone lactonase YvrE